MRYLAVAVVLAVLGVGFVLYKTFSQPFVIQFSPSTEASANPASAAPAADERLMAQVLTPVEVNVAQVVEQDAPTVAQLFKESKELVAKLSVCLASANLCGQKKERGSNYFDPERTPEHRNLNRALMVMAEIIDNDVSYTHAIDRADLLRVTQINNDNAPILALQILGRAKMTEGEINTVLGNTRSLRGQVRSLMLQNLAADEMQKNPAVRANYVTAVFAAVADQSDRLTALEVHKNLSRYNLEKEEFTQAVSKSCFLRRDGMGEDLWPMLKKSIVLQGESMGFAINPDEYCGP